MNYTDVKEWFDLSKSALDLFKAAIPLLPKGRQRDEVEQKVKQAADLLTRSDAKLAKDLGYHLCECTFPPQPMLWREAAKEYRCQRPECGHAIAAITPDKLIIRGIKGYS